MAVVAHQSERHIQATRVGAYPAGSPVAAIEPSRRATSAEWALRALQGIRAHAVLADNSPDVAPTCRTEHVAVPGPASLPTGSLAPAPRGDCGNPPRDAAGRTG